MLNFNGLLFLGAVNMIPKLIRMVWDDTELDSHGKVKQTHPIIRLIAIGAVIFVSPAFLAAAAGAVYVKLSQVSFAATEATLWTPKNWLDFFAFVINLCNLNKGDAEVSLDYLFVGSDGKVQADDQKAISTAHKLLMLASMQRHGFWKALMWYNTMDGPKVQQLFVVERHVERSVDIEHVEQHRKCHKAVGPLQQPARPKALTQEFLTKSDGDGDTPQTTDEEKQALMACAAALACLALMTCFAMMAGFAFLSAVMQ